MQFPSVFQAGTWQMNVALLTTAALATRVVQRFYFVNRLYGWEHALMSIPRMVVGNMINFMATARAWKVFLAYLLFGKRMVWDKTMHDFPDAAQLVQTRKQLGELLTTWQAVEPERLQQALAQQHAGRRQPLGRILLTQGWLDDETWPKPSPSDLPRAVIDIDYLRAGSFPVSADACVQWRMLPLPPQQQTLRLAVASPLPEDALALLKQETRSAHIEQSIARESEINAGLRLIGGDQHWQLDNVPLLGDLLVEMRLIDHARFEIALDAYKPQRDGRIGDYRSSRASPPRTPSPRPCRSSAGVRPRCSRRLPEPYRHEDHAAVHRHRCRPGNGYRAGTGAGRCAAAVVRCGLPRRRAGLRRLRAR